MSSRTRWIFAAIALIVIIALGVISAGEREPRTRIVRRGETLVLAPFEVQPDDLYRCPGKGGINGTPSPGHGAGGSGGLSVVTYPNGVVVAECEPGKPGNV